MQYSTLAFALFPVAVFGSAQINFYSDNNCQNYIGTSYASLSGVAVGGPAGSKSMLFVNADSCSDTCGPNLYFCKNQACSAYDLASRFGQCKSFTNGVWAAEDCGCL
ncbi:endo-1,4-beta-xylanase D precursor protein [Rutstroemia sp. NJR-2017a WRK4]|nr:endo-14-beta-xylanase D precursor protein [Rutstroemia sp. NJR-2017a BBW]PQE23133.1 endo-1,4-beta-xylanase D precursor protein [Rutstroemia sp. NJR-2017a WRK4]